MSGRGAGTREVGGVGLREWEGWFGAAELKVCVEETDNVDGEKSRVAFEFFLMPPVAGIRCVFPGKPLWLPRSHSVTRIWDHRETVRAILPNSGVSDRSKAQSGLSRHRTRWTGVSWGGDAGEGEIEGSDDRASAGSKLGALGAEGSSTVRAIT